MMRHGIGTTIANYWLHFHPLEYGVYLYRVEQMREWMKTRQVIDGKSKSGKKTGKGVLCPKSLEFVRRKNSRAWQPYYDWESMTDRERGTRGQWIIFMAASLRVLFPDTTEQWVYERDREKQNSGYDMVAGPCKVEIKTECFRSDFLFIQTEEGEHDVHAVSGGGHRFSNYY